MDDAIARTGEAPEQPPTEAEKVAMALLAMADARSAFGPSFFLGQLGGFVRDRCADPALGLPRVRLHLFSGDVLDLCHVIALGPRFVSLAVWDDDQEMHTEIVPYEGIVRVSVRSASGEEARVGFNQQQAPTVHLSPEQTLRAAARVAETSGSSDEVPP